MRVLVIHPMEIVQRKDGKPVDKNYHFINRVVVTYLDKEIAQFETTQSISENPFFTFAFKATEPGVLRSPFSTRTAASTKARQTSSSPEPHAPVRCSVPWLWVVVGVLAAGCVKSEREGGGRARAPPPWVSRAVPEGRGDIKTRPDGRARQCAIRMDHRGLRPIPHLRLR